MALLDLQDFCITLIKYLYLSGIKFTGLAKKQHSNFIYKLHSQFNATSSIQFQHGTFFACHFLSINLSRLISCHLSNAYL